MSQSEEKGIVIYDYGLWDKKKLAERQYFDAKWIHVI